VIGSSQDHLGTGTRDLNHHVLIGAKNTDITHVGFFTMVMSLLL
jgi:hypothetical protein